MSETAGSVTYPLHLSFHIILLVYPPAPSPPTMCVHLHLISQLCTPLLEGGHGVLPCPAPSHPVLSYPVVSLPCLFLPCPVCLTSPSTRSYRFIHIHHSIQCPNRINSIQTILLRTQHKSSTSYSSYIHFIRMVEGLVRHIR